MPDSKNMPDRFLLIIITILLLWGFFTVAAVSFHFSLEKYGTSWKYFNHQLIFGIFPGIIIGFLFFKLSPEKLKKISFLLFAVNLILVLMVFFPKIGIELNGARRWLKIGSVSFQPSEFLKLNFLLYLSAWLSNKLHGKKGAKKIGWQAFVVFITTIIVLGLIMYKQSDLSTFMIIAAIGFMAYFSSPTPFWHYLAIAIMIGLAVFVFIKISPYRLDRVLTVLNPQNDPLGKGYQLKQSLVAIGSGKIFGIGSGLSLGLSRQKFGFLPQPMTDSIFSIIGEELGFFGAIIMLVLLLAFFWRGMVLAFAKKCEFSKLLCFGIVFWITFQAFFNIGGIIGILPLAGIPLPFFSYGSSHLVAELAAMGILLNVSRKT